MYDLWFHRVMCADDVRVSAYAKAIRAEVKPDDVVLDVGCGVGVLSVLAAKAGARRVYAVDLDDSVHYARRVVVENGVGDRVDVFRGRIQDVELPEKPTLIVADVRGGLPWGVGAAPAWNAARAKAAPHVRTIPTHDVVMAEPVTSDTLDARIRRLAPIEGVSLAALRPSLALGWERPDPDVRPLAPAGAVAEVRYDAPLVDEFDGTVTFETTRPVSVDGFRVGFEAHLAPGVSYRSFGEGAARVYGSLLLPTRERLAWRPETPLALRVSRRRVSGGPGLLWSVRLGDAEGAWQGEMLEQVLSLDVLRASLPGHVSKPDAVDEVRRVALEALRDGRTVAQAVSRALSALPAGTPREEVEEEIVELSRRRQARTVRRIEDA